MMVLDLSSGVQNQLVSRQQGHVFEHKMLRSSLILSLGCVMPN
jgi:hypothetical protein